jgi:hypothetical protein
MAKDKKGFILYADQKALFDQLPNEKAGELIKHIFSYVNDENPITEDLIINLAFTPIKQQLKRDLVKFEETKEKRSEAGKAGANKRWQNIANDSKRISTIAKIADNVNDNVNVKDINIPSIDEFLAYALSKEPNINTNEVKLKYESWLVNDWSVIRNNKNIKIKNWKSTLLNTIPYISKIQTQVKSLDQQLYENVMKQMNANK